LWLFGLLTALANFYSVARYRKKFVAFLVAVALGSGVFLSVSAQSGTDRPESEDSTFKAGALFANDPNFTSGAAGTPGGQEFFSKIMLSILLVVALGAATIYVSGKVLPKITNLPGKQIHVLETTHLGPRKAVHLVKIGDQQLLIGSTNESINTLADVTSALTEFSAQQIDDSVRT
jgi:flagellar biosynthetic protein FliO